MVNSSASVARIETPRLGWSLHIDGEFGEFGEYLIDNIYLLSFRLGVSDCDQVAVLSCKDQI